MNYLLDTNVISDAIKPRPQEASVQWLGSRSERQLFLSATTVGEIKRGILELPSGRKRQALEQWYAGPDGPRAKFGARILAFDYSTAEVWASLIADGRRKGRPRNAIDMMIAATALTHDCSLVTFNERDFEGVVDVVNPLKNRT